MAARLNGREYGKETTRADAQDAKESGLVIIHGASDDLVEFVGAFDEEIGACDGVKFFLARDEADDPYLVQTIDDEDVEVLEKYGVLDDVRDGIDKSARFEALWCEDDFASWTFETNVPHATFEIMEDGGVFCRGIVISADDLPEV